MSIRKSFRLPDSAARYLAALAKHFGLTEPSIVTLALHEYYERHNDGIKVMARREANKTGLRKPSRRLS